MALREIPMTGEQPMFPAIELGETVRQIAAIEAEKAAANSDWNDELKYLKKKMFRLADEMKEMK